MQLTPSQKGAIAEAAVTAAAIKLGLLVLRPACEGARYDLMIDLDREVIRIQCKWARRVQGALAVALGTCRITPAGYVRTTYGSHEVDAIAEYSSELERCYLVPINEVAGMSEIRLRLGPTLNSQAIGIRWAHRYAFEESIRRNWIDRRRSAPADSPAHR